MEKYHNVDKAKNKIAIKNMTANFIEKLRNFNIYPFIDNKFDFLWALKI